MQTLSKQSSGQAGLIDFSGVQMDQILLVIRYLAPPASSKLFKQSPCNKRILSGQLSDKKIIARNGEARGDQ